MEWFRAWPGMRLEFNPLRVSFKSFQQVCFWLFFTKLRNSSITHRVGRPNPLQNCSLSIESEEAVVVDCIEGLDTGLPQSFLLEVVDDRSQLLVRNMSLSVSSYKVRTFVEFFITSITLASTGCIPFGRPAT